MRAQLAAVCLVIWGCSSSNGGGATAADAAVDAETLDGPADSAFARDLPPYERAPAPPPPSSAGTAWKTSEIGEGTMSTARVQLGGSLIVRGGGRDIGGAADSFVLHGVPIKGDGQVVARLRSLQAADPRSTAGVMIRGGVDPGAPAVFYGQLGDPAMGGQYVVRGQAGATATASAADPQVRNQFLRIVRRGRTFSIARSNDRVAWFRVTSVDVDMPEDVVVGLAVAARSPMGMATGEFDFVEVLGLDAGAAAETWDVDPLGITAAAPVATIAGGQVAINALSDAFTTAAENGAALLSPRNGDNTITARIESIAPATGRLGLNFREGTVGRLSPNSRNVLLGVRANGLVEFQRRDRSTNFDAGQSKMLALPVWLRLARRDDPAAGTTTVTGWYSADGQSWTVLDSALFSAPDPLMAGLVYSSGSTASYGTGTASGFAVTAGSPPVETPLDAGVGQ